MFFFNRKYRLNHCRKVMQENYKLYQKNGKPPAIKEKLIALEEAINQSDRAKADRLTRELETLSKKTFHKSWFFWGIEVAGALLFALAVATVIRQSWFELYEIPTGSMRPTFKEQDHLTVSKTQFGINIPLVTDHFMFDPELVQRNSAIIFSGDGIALNDTDSTFLKIFPYKKRYIKRLLGKPNDEIYFYGGQLFGKDKDGLLITDYEQGKLEYIPIIGFEGNIRKQDAATYIFSYFNKPYARAKTTPFGTWQGEIYNGKEWIADDVSKSALPHESINTLSDFFGMGNYAMAQIFTKEELAYAGLKSPQEGVLYLVIRHTPHLDFKKLAGEVDRLPLVMTTVLPLQQEDLETLFASMYTARFDVKNGKARRYSLEPIAFNRNAPVLEGVPDGTYEFYYGNAYEIKWGGTAFLLPKDHPLYRLTPERLQLLYNLGIAWDNQFQPKKGSKGWPNRYAYFRDGDLYLLGGLFLKKDDPKLTAFLNNEEKKLNQALISPLKTKARISSLLLLCKSRKNTILSWETTMR